MIPQRKKKMSFILSANFNYSNAIVENYRNFLIKKYFSLYRDYCVEYEQKISIIKTNYFIPA